MWDPGEKSVGGVVVMRFPAGAKDGGTTSPACMSLCFKSKTDPAPAPPPIQRGPGGLHEDDGVAPTLLESGGQRDVHVDGDGARGAAGRGRSRTGDGGVTVNNLPKGRRDCLVPKWETHTHTQPIRKLELRSGKARDRSLSQGVDGCCLYLEISYGVESEGRDGRKQALMV